MGDGNASMTGGGATGGVAPPGEMVLPWTERGVVVCGDGDYDARALTELAGRAGWPVPPSPRPAPGGAPALCPPTSTCWRRRSSSGRTSPT